MCGAQDVGGAGCAWEWCVDRKLAVGVQEIIMDPDPIQKGWGTDVLSASTLPFSHLMYIAYEEEVLDDAHRGDQHGCLGRKVWGGEGLHG